MNTSTKNDRDLRQIMIWGSSLPAGAILAALQALQRDFSFRVSIITPIAFILGTALVLGFWRIIFATKKPSLRITASVLLIVGGLAAFLYPLRYVVPSRLAELFTGLAAAICALSLAAIMMLKLRNFFNADERDTLRAS